MVGWQRGDANIQLCYTTLTDVSWRRYLLQIYFVRNAQPTIGVNRRLRSRFLHLHLAVSQQLEVRARLLVILGQRAQLVDNRWARMQTQEQDPTKQELPTRA